MTAPKKRLVDVFFDRVLPVLHRQEEPRDLKGGSVLNELKRLQQATNLRPKPLYKGSITLKTIKHLLNQRLSPKEKKSLVASFELLVNKDYKKTICLACWDQLFKKGTSDSDIQKWYSSYLKRHRKSLEKLDTMLIPFVRNGKWILYEVDLPNKKICCFGPSKRRRCLPLSTSKLLEVCHKIQPEKRVASKKYNISDTTMMCICLLTRASNLDVHNISKRLVKNYGKMYVAACLVNNKLENSYRFVRGYNKVRSPRQSSEQFITDSGKSLPNAATIADYCHLRFSKKVACQRQPSSLKNSSYKRCCYSPDELKQRKKEKSKEYYQQETRTKHSKHLRRPILAQPVKKKSHDPQGPKPLEATILKRK